MKKHIQLLTLPALCLFAEGAINVPGANGTSGVLNITADTVIDLSLAADGQWDGANTANGIYDSEKWAVVFNYSSVTVAEGATLTFTNHPSTAPVVWLVSENVTIGGIVSLNGQSSATPPLISKPGPGGFRGGVGYTSPGASGGAGFGVGGGQTDRADDGYGASYGSVGGNGPSSYGNPSIVPLIGGSGGGGNANGRNGGRVGGGAGGGALLIACSNSIDVSGTLRANGGNGNGNFWDYQGGAGSGGGIRIVANHLVGSGDIQAIGGSSSSNSRGLNGGLGRIRIERNNNDSTTNITPDPSIIPLTDNDTALLWPPSTAPQVEVISIGGETPPADPRASFGAEGADVAIAETATTPIVIETTNVEAASTVQVRITPRSNANATVIDATLASTESTGPLVIRWTADLPVNTGYSAVQVKVVRP